MGLRYRWLLMTVLFAGTWFCGNAGAANLFINFSALGVASCDQTHIEGNVTASFNLAPGANNLIVTIAINGGTPVSTFLTENPPTDSGAAFFSYTIPSTVQPYTIQAKVFPALNGLATGTGFNATYLCNANGTLSAVFTPATIGVAAAVPTLSQWGLGALMVLLAVGSVVQLRRKN